MHIQAPVRVGGGKAWAFCEDGALQAPERDFAFPHLYLSISFPSVSPPFPLFPFSFPSFTPFRELQPAQIFIDSTWWNMETAGQSV